MRKTCTITRSRNAAHSAANRSGNRNNQERLTSGALSTATTITEILAGAVLALFTLIFLLHGGRNIFAFITLPFPPEVRERVRDAGRAGFRSRA